MAGFTPKLPLNLDNKQGYTLIENIKDLAVQNFLMILLTNPGERIMDLEFGVGIKKVLFENFNSFSTTNFESRLQGQISKYAPYLQIKNINYLENTEDFGLLHITMKIYIIPLGEGANITISKNGSIITNDDSNV